MSARKHHVYVLFGLIITFALLVSACQGGGNSASDLPVAVLFVGDGIITQNGGVDVHLEGLVNENGMVPSIEVTSVNKNHTFLDKLWGYASKDFEAGNFDVVILQTSLDEFWDDGAGRETFFDTVRQIDAEVSAKGSKTLLLMTWALSNTRAITNQDVVEIYSQIGEELGIIVVPAGLAIEAAIVERPDYDLLETNQIIPNWRGTYLTSLVLYATIYQNTPEGFEYQPGNIYAEIESLAYKAEKWHMNEDELSFLQRIAWETVTTYPLSGVTE